MRQWAKDRDLHRAVTGDAPPPRPSERVGSRARNLSQSRYQAERRLMGSPHVCSGRGGAARAKRPTLRGHCAEPGFI
jgi:hypothetical protein